MSKLPGTTPGFARNARRERRERNTGGAARRASPEAHRSAHRLTQLPPGRRLHAYRRHVATPRPLNTPFRPRLIVRHHAATIPHPLMPDAEAGGDAVPSLPERDARYAMPVRLPLRQAPQKDENSADARKMQRRDSAASCDP